MRNLRAFFVGRVDEKRRERERRGKEGRKKKEESKEERRKKKREVSLKKEYVFFLFHTYKRINSNRSTTIAIFLYFSKLESFGFRSV